MVAATAALSKEKNFAEASNSSTSHFDNLSRGPNVDNLASERTDKMADSSSTSTVLGNNNVDGRIEEPASTSCSEIAREFARQYYSMFNEKRDYCYRFYGNNSLLFRNGITFVGQADVQNFFSSLDLPHCYVRIILVDSMETTDRGILVHVFGDIANKHGPLRRFVQVFILALQKDQKRYYVLNDTMRYFDEILQYNHYIDPMGKCDKAGSDTVNDSCAKQNPDHCSADLAPNGLSQLDGRNTSKSSEASVTSAASTMDAKAVPFIPASQVTLDASCKDKNYSHEVREELSTVDRGTESLSSSNVKDCQSDEFDKVDENVEQPHSNLTAAPIKSDDVIHNVACSSPVLPNSKIATQSTTPSVTVVDVAGSGVSYALVAGGHIGAKPPSSSAPIVSAAAFNIIQPMTTPSTIGTGGAHHGLLTSAGTVAPYAYQLTMQDMCDGTGGILGIPVIPHNALVNGASHPTAALYSPMDFVHGQQLAAAAGHQPPPGLQHQRMSVQPRSATPHQLVPQTFERQIYVRDFPSNVTREELGNYFSRFGTVEEVTIKPAANPRDGSFAFVTFERMETVSHILSVSADQHQLRNCTLKIEKKRPFDSRGNRNRLNYRMAGSASSIGGNIPTNGHHKNPSFNRLSGYSSSVSAYSTQVNACSNSMAAGGYSNQAAANYNNPHNTIFINTSAFQQMSGGNQKGSSSHIHHAAMNG